MHEEGTYRLGNTHITGLKSNHTTSRPITLAGVIDSDGTCYGGAYSDPYGTWSDVIVIGTVRITLQDYTADVRINTNKVQLRSGVSCEFSSTHCVDIEGGDTYWNTVPVGPCKFNNYGILYEGYAYKIIDDEQHQTVYSLTTQDAIFALTSKGKQEVCGYSLIRTEHPKLMIFETVLGTVIFKKQSRISNLDIFTYMNSKFVYVEKHIRTQISQLYHDILLQQCNLEQRMLQNALAIATQSPDIFAYHLMKGPGYMALQAGEVIHIIKCVPVEVTLAQTDRCYNQLPVLRENLTYYLTPQTHILLRQGTQTTCNALAPAVYLLGDEWYKFMPRPVDTTPPIVMKPLTKPVWKYVSPGSLATSGIYTESDLKELRDHIMFPAERPAVLNSLARGIMGRPISLQRGSISNLLDVSIIDKIAVSTWEKIWSKFLIFGNISVGLMKIYFSIKIMKLILDTIVHGYALHTIYGWSLYLLGALWDSLTHLILHLKTRQPKKPKPTAPALNSQNYRGLENTYDETEVNPTTVYPLLLATENVTYTFELKEAKF
ncbi:hypothetical protein RF55_17519 [Lasius niger]|uniref:Glycoprotein n=1 Tax=Lasius niger TaxID=67767 RepID=A0A0J7K332_LASNI|nr:hypothetical protein RF55_17519 [Lasius niger]